MKEIIYPTVMEFSYEEDRKTKKSVSFASFDAKKYILYYEFEFKGKTYSFPVIGKEEVDGALWEAEDSAPMFRRHYMKALKNNDIRIVVQK